MDLQFGLAMVLGIGPALILMYVILRNYTYPRVEQPFFSDPAFFGLFMVGLVIGSVLFFALTAMRLGGGLIYMILLAIIEMMAMVVVMNLVVSGANPIPCSMDTVSVSEWPQACPPDSATSSRARWSPSTPP